MRDSLGDLTNHHSPFSSKLPLGSAKRLRQTSLLDSFSSPLASKHRSSSPFHDSPSASRGIPTLDYASGEREHQRLFKKRKLDENSTQGFAVPSNGRPRPRKTKSDILMYGDQVSNIEDYYNRILRGERLDTRKVSSKNILTNFVTTENLCRYLQVTESAYATVPFTLGYSNAAKKGGKQILAAAGEEGVVQFFDTRDAPDESYDPQLAMITAHHNAIWSLKWRCDDQILATASGDKTVKLWDTTTRQCVGVLGQHVRSVKDVTWDPNNNALLATSSRDGCIRIWDTRVFLQQDGDSYIGCVNMIRNAHKSEALIRSKASKAKGDKSVTSVVYMKQDSNFLASSGSTDGIVKLWDLRKSHTRRTNPDFSESTPTLSIDEERDRGITNMALSPSGRVLFALKTDGRISSYDTINLGNARGLTTYRHSGLKATFYSQVAVSPCGRFLSATSLNGGVYLWDIEGPGGDGIRLGVRFSTTSEPIKDTCGIDWGHQQFATCSDDYKIRIWVNDETAAQQFRENETSRSLGHLQ